MKLRESGALLSNAGEGRFLLQLISPGSGSSGNYSEAAIKQAADDRIFKAGTLSFIDHQTDDEDWQRPEGSIKDLAAVLIEDARWDERLNALVAEARVFEHWRPLLAEMKDTIGVSIRAWGEAEDTADGRVITKITEARSVDFVTKAGRGGRILEVLEADRPDTLEGIARLFETTRPPAGKEETGKEPTMGKIEIEEAAHTDLLEKSGRVDSLEAELTEAQKKIAAFEAKEAEGARREHVSTLVAEAFKDVDDPADVASLIVETHMAESFTDEQITTAAKSRAEKLAAASTNPVHGVGHTAPMNESMTNDGPVTWDDIAAVKGL